MDLARLTRMSFFQGMPQLALVRLAEAATEEQRPAGGMVLHQSDRAWAVHFLVTGSVQILLRVGDEDLLVAVLRRPSELLGWSAFRAPYRYTTSVRCEEPSRLVRIPAAAFEELFERDPAFGYDVLQRVAVCVADRLETHERGYGRRARARWEGAHRERLDPRAAGEVAVPGGARPTGPGRAGRPRKDGGGRPWRAGLRRGRAGHRLLPARLRRRGALLRRTGGRRGRRHADRHPPGPPDRLVGDGGAGGDRLALGHRQAGDGAVLVGR